MHIINLTPHAIVLRSHPETDTTILPSGVVARVMTTPGSLGVMEGIPVPIAHPTTYGSVEGIPVPIDNTIYLVSGLVLSRTNRPDVFGPGTGPSDGAIRNDKGQIIAVTRLIAAV